MQPLSESALTHASSTEIFIPTQPQSSPCTRIDLIICDLITHIETYSDDDFDADWMHLTNLEVEALVIALIRHSIETVNGKLLSGYLLESRQEEDSSTEDETG